MRKVLKGIFDPVFSIWEFCVIAVTVDVMIDAIGFWWAMFVLWALMIGGYAVRERLQ